MNNKRGFTLIELIVALIIIGILVLLATPRFLKTIKLARYTQIINDIRVIEDVSTAYMVKNKELPKNKGLVNDEDLIKQVEESKSYLKNGLIQLKDSENKKVDVGNIKLVDKDDLKGFYILDKELFIRPETRTRLKGDFLINQDGISIYVDKKGYDWNLNDSKSKYNDILEILFTTNTSTNKCEVTIKGIKDGQEESFKKQIIKDNNVFKVQGKFENDYGISCNVSAISENAFKKKDSEGFMKKVDFTEATELSIIGSSAFEGNNIEKINFNNNRELKSIGDSSFKDNKIRKIDLSKNKNLTGIYPYAFKMQANKFVNEIILPTIPDLTLREGEVDSNSDIFGKFDPSNENTSINNVYSNEDSKITQTFIRENEEGIWIKKSGD